ncbi:hypothetical protein J3R30DRAFT_3694927 [Lentinula aciculospora]|uniref:Uncharacterized protein n=1 Tax=Lentinula aciculospora TaxID=153920 RepID=A0A9W9DY80_9AGAR|nr:hypothetical protein J3R30DRAFT_3694927 [Lentinula aciculospora]
MKTSWESRVCDAKANLIKFLDEDEEIVENICNVGGEGYLNFVNTLIKGPAVQGLLLETDALIKSLKRQYQYRTSCNTSWNTNSNNPNLTKQDVALSAEPAPTAITMANCPEPKLPASTAVTPYRPPTQMNKSSGVQSGQASFAEEDNRFAYFAYTEDHDINNNVDNRLANGNMDDLEGLLEELIEIPFRPFNIASLASSENLWVNVQEGLLDDGDEIDKPVLDGNSNHYDSFSSNKLYVPSEDLLLADHSCCNTKEESIVLDSGCSWHMSPNLS